MKICEFPFFLRMNLSVSDRKGLISRVAQYISPGTLLILINYALGYQNQQRKICIRQNQVQPHDSSTIVVVFTNTQRHSYLFVARIQGS